jgi:hypothetical protein
MGTKKFIISLGAFVFLAGVIYSGFAFYNYSQKLKRIERNRQFERGKQQEYFEKKKRVEEREKRWSTVHELRWNFFSAYEERYIEIEDMTSEDIAKGKPAIELEKDFLKDYAREMEGRRLNLFVKILDVRIDQNHRIIELQDHPKQNNILSYNKEREEQLDELLRKSRIDTAEKSGRWFDVKAIGTIAFVFYDDNRILENVHRGDLMDIRVEVEKADFARNVITVYCNILEVLENYGTTKPLDEDREL